MSSISKQNTLSGSYFSQNDLQKLSHSIIQHSHEEKTLLDRFISHHASIYDFNNHGYHNLFRILCKYRLLSKTYLSSVTLPELLKLFQIIRMLSRDHSIQGIIIELEALPVLVNYLEHYSHEYFNSSNLPIVSDIILEVCNTLKRFTLSIDHIKLLFSFNLHQIMCLLLSSHDIYILLPTLSLFYQLYLNGDQEYFLEMVSPLCIVEPLLQIVSDFDDLSLYFSPRHTTHSSLHTQSLHLTFELLDIISNTHSGRQDMHIFNAITIYLCLLHQNLPETIILRLLQTICKMAKDINIRKEIKQHNGIPLLLNMIHISPLSFPSYSSSPIPNQISLNSSELSPSNQKIESQSQSQPSTNVLLAVCSVLTQISLDDENSYQIRKGGGVYRVGHLLIHPTLGQNAELQLRALRTLRFLYGIERNRKCFKKLFPPDIFSAFIDIGHYETSIDRYLPVVQMINQMSSSQKSHCQQMFEDLNLSSHKKRIVKHYILQEIIGKGAFGTVYSCHIENGDKLYALKELPLKQRFTGSHVSEEKITEVVQSMVSETKIISTLHHPNIIKYYSSFVENDCLYILMEYVEGITLLDYINSMSEKKEAIPEKIIWQIFIQILLALCYIHMDMTIIHRDLTPSNIMVESNMHVKLADFGLAKEIHNDQIMQSVVGTISYCCPEIVQHREYNVKADIWSLGAILYHMAHLSPPFTGSNPLTVANKIVNGHYPELDNRYSPLLRQVVKQLLTIDPQERPDVVQISHMISPLLMIELDQQQQRLQKIEKDLIIEQNYNQRLMNQNRQALLSSQSQFHHKEYNRSLLSPSSSSYNTSLSLSNTHQCTPITIPLHKLQQISDPVGVLLTTLQKIFYIVHRPPSLKRDIRRHYIIQYYRALSRIPPNQSHLIKEEMKKLLNGVKENIEIIGQKYQTQPLSNSMNSINNKDEYNNISTNRITYEEMQNMIEEILSQDGNYNDINQKPPLNLSSLSINTSAVTAPTSLNLSPLSFPHNTNTSRVNSLPINNTFFNSPYIEKEEKKKRKMNKKR